MRTFRVKYQSGIECEIRCENVEYADGVFLFRSCQDFPLIVRAENIRNMFEVRNDVRGSCHTAG